MNHFRGWLDTVGAGRRPARLALAVLAMFAVGCAASKSNTVVEKDPGGNAAMEPDLAKEIDAKVKSWVTASGLQVEEVKQGEGEAAADGKTAVVYYLARRQHGEILHSSKALGHPLAFELGKGQVVPGVEEGVKGMKAGGRRRLTVPPHLGYGNKRVSNADKSITVAPDTTMVYDIHLVEIK